MRLGAAGRGEQRWGSGVLLACFRGPCRGKLSASLHPRGGKQPGWTVGLQRGLPAVVFAGRLWFEEEGCSWPPILGLWERAWLLRLGCGPGAVPCPWLGACASARGETSLPGSLRTLPLAALHPCSGCPRSCPPPAPLGCPHLPRCSARADARWLRAQRGRARALLRSCPRTSAWQQSLAAKPGRALEPVLDSGIAALLGTVFAVASEE